MDNMDLTRITALSDRFSAPVTRRRGLALLAGFGLVSGSLIEATDARKKKRKKKKKPAPSPAGPVAQTDASCIRDGSAWIETDWVAQTFRAIRSGPLTSASVWLDPDVAVASFAMEIWTVDINDKPGTVLAGTAISGAQAKPAATGQVTGVFAAPANVVAGLRYALVFTTPPGQIVDVRLHPQNLCADGTMLIRNNGQIVPAPDVDLHFETIVTA